MKKVIVATDFSSEAENALHYACGAAAEAGYELILFSLHTLSIHAQHAILSAEALLRTFQTAQDKLDRVARDMRMTYGIQVTPHWATGDFYRELNHCIGAHQADLAVFGTPKRSVEQELLGNTTTAAINRLKIPVLTVPPAARYTGIRTILFACDIVRGVHKAMLDNVRSVAADFHAAVEVFHVRNRMEELYGHPAETPASISEAFEGVDYYYKSIASSRVVMAIREEVINSGADMLIMVPYKYGFWNSVVHRSKTRVMASSTDIPLLTLPALQ